MSVYEQKSSQPGEIESNHFYPNFDKIIEGVTNMDRIEHLALENREKENILNITFYIKSQRIMQNKEERIF
jgi:hypothetical protein